MMKMQKEEAPWPFQTHHDPCPLFLGCQACSNFCNFVQKRAGIEEEEQWTKGGFGTCLRPLSIGQTCHFLALKKQASISGGARPLQSHTQPPSTPTSVFSSPDRIQPPLQSFR